MALTSFAQDALSAPQSIEFPVNTLERTLALVRTGSAMHGGPVSMGMIGGEQIGLIFVLEAPLGFACHGAALSRNKNRHLFSSCTLPF